MISGPSSAPTTLARPSATRAEANARHARRHRAAAALGAFAALGLTAADGGAQGPAFLERLGLDRLRLTGVGATYGVVKPSTIVSTNTLGVHADYGAIAPRWRLVFGATYWRSRYSDAAVARYADSLLAAVDDPTGDATVDLGRVTASAIGLTADARYTPRRGAFRPYFGASFGGWAMNAEGRAIRGTFVEDALDNISAGVAAVAGAEATLSPNIMLGMHARYDILSGARFATLRTGVTYVFRAREVR